jgi:diguanylate cyclase (GGDEF)-like protein
VEPQRTTSDAILGRLGRPVASLGIGVAILVLALHPADMVSLYTSVPAALTLLGVSGRLVLALHDATRTNDALARSHTDDLTALPNRHALRSRVDAAITRGTGLALAVLDLDGFKDINDTFGHPAGDTVLEQVGRRIREAVPALATVARLGGDEFGILIPRSDAALMAQTVHDALDELGVPIHVEGIDVALSASVGIAVWTGDGPVDSTELLRRAEVAMYRGKGGAQSSVVMYQPAHDDSSKARLRISDQLRRGIANGELEVWYQPQIDASTMRPCALEALVRWRHPTGGLLSPVAFLPAARRAGLMPLLSQEVVRLAVADLARWHAAGDAVLIDVAQRLSECVRQSDTVARLGGDEFALLLEDVNPPEVSSACDRILTSLSRGAHVAGHQLALSASIGVAFGDSSETAESMLRNADLAMYEAKARGKNQWVEYERAIGRSRLQRLELVESLRASVAAGDLTLVYQPVVRASTGYITGVEALARWKSNGVDVPPDVFIRVAEETGLVVALGDVVLDQAARDAAVISQAAGGDFNVSVNISAKQLREPDFVTKVERAMSQMDGATLVLEITERDGIGNDPASMSAMTTLADRGVPFAIDDFGVGFSSIGYLQDMPVRIIKTDLSFSESIDRDERSCALLCSITMMGQALGLDVVVEGIERASQLDHLREHVHAPFAQGYLMHRPMPLDQLVKVIAENRALPPIPQRDPARVAPSV